MPGGKNFARLVGGAADIEDADFERRVRVGRAQEIGDVLFLAN
jgi:hypothetical protein